METGIRLKRKLTTSEETINYTFIDDAECPSKDCRECAYLNNCKTEIIERWSKIPDYVLNKLLKLKPSSVKVFLVINRRAEFRPGYNYGICKLSIAKIKKDTKLSENTICKNIKELKANKLINCEIDRDVINKEWKTGHTFYILWMLLDKEIKEPKSL